MIDSWDKGKAINGVASRGDVALSPAPATTGSGFRGFLRPNVVTTPNHFTDVCLPNHPVHVIRVVAFLLYRHLAFHDEHGEPLEDRFAFSQREIAEGSGVAKSKITEALRIAVASNFLRQVKKGQKASNGHKASSNIYEIRWHSYGEAPYRDTLRQFKGFSPIDEDRWFTNLPEDFFNHVVPHNSKSVIRFVGAVLRNTIGQKTRAGKGRKTTAALSYLELRRYLKIAPATLAAAISKALDAGYVVRKSAGTFDPTDRTKSEKAIYAVNWYEPETYDRGVPKTVSTIHGRSVGLSVPKIESNERPQNCIESVPKTEPVKRPQNCIGSKREDNIKEQQQAGVRSGVAVVGEDVEQVLEDLIRVGIRFRDAQKIASEHSPETIRQQIEWLPDRNPSNPPGMLRRAIEENWDAPRNPSVATSQPDESLPEVIFARGFYAGAAGSDDSLAEPSTKDIAQAQRCVERLTEIWGDSEAAEITKWGRGLGAWYAENHAKMALSLVSALRVGGDRLVARHRSRKESEGRRKKEAQGRRQSERYEALKGDWLSYLAEREGELRESDRYAEFEAKRDAERENIETMGLTPKLRASFLRRFDDEESRLLDLQEFFGDELLEFERWDYQTNEKGL